MKCASVPSAYRNCILRASVRTGRNFSPARNVRSITAPSEARRSLVRTNAPPLPGLTCWNSRILKTVPSTSMWLPFLNWLVEIMVNRLSASDVETDCAPVPCASRPFERIEPVWGTARAEPFGTITAMGELTLTTTLQRRGPAAAVVLTAEQVADLGEGRKAFPVQATINEHTWAGRVARMGGEFVLGLNRQVRTGAGVEAGDEGTVAITPHEAPRPVEVPPALAPG